MITHPFWCMFAVQAYPAEELKSKENLAMASFANIPLCQIGQLFYQLFLCVAVKQQVYFVNQDQGIWSRMVYHRQNLDQPLLPGTHAQG